MKAPEILYEDNHIIAINKQAGDIVQGDKTGDIPLNEQLKDFIKKRDNKPGNVFVGTIHRLDRPVSGVILFAKTSKALSRLNKMFAEKKVQKTYNAITIIPPFPKEGRLIHYLRKDKQRNVTKAYEKPVNDGLKSELTYKILSQVGDETLVEVKPLTGRPHQIRVQLASLMAVIKGDLKYGAPMPNKDKSICLHARSITFMHPVKQEEITIHASLPSTNSWKNFHHQVRNNKIKKA